MPRKPKLPNMGLRIESLSTGEVVQRPMVDELGEGLIEPVKQAPRTKPIPMPEDMAEARAKRKQEMGLSLLERLRLVEQAELVASKPKLAYNQRVVIIGGVERVITVTHTDRKPFPRRI